MHQAYNLLITGGTGFFGRSILRSLIKSASKDKNGPTIKVLSRSPETFLRKYPEFDGYKWLNFLKGNVLDFESLPYGEKFTHIIHAATDSTFGSLLDPLTRYKQIVDGTENMLKYAVKVGASRYLLTSSGGVYGQQPYNLEKIPESYLGMADPLRFDSAYSVGKRAAEHLCVLYQDKYGIETVIARCFAFVGQDLPLNAHFAIGNFIRDAIREDAITVTGDGTAVRSYLDQLDLADWLITLLVKGENGQAYNVGSDVPISIGELAHLVRDLLSPGKPIRFLGIEKDNGIRSRYVPDISRVRNELGLDVTISLKHAIQGVLNSRGENMIMR